MPVTYFELWMTRLMGYLPDLSECIVCGRTLNGSRAFFTLCRWLDVRRRQAPGVVGNIAGLAALAAQMFRAPVESFAGTPWPKQQGRDLRKFLIQTLQRHIEKKLVTAGMLELALH